MQRVETLQTLRGHDTVVWSLHVVEVEEHWIAEAAWRVRYVCIVHVKDRLTQPRVNLCLALGGGVSQHQQCGRRNVIVVANYHQL